MLRKHAWLPGMIGALLFGIVPVGAEVGVTADAIRIGQVCALTGAAQGLGQEMRAGASAYFAHVNSQGGVHGRKITLMTLDDGYEPEKTIEATTTLIEQE
jgi:branched-chain amino acid transport system substrate-binding protein